MESLLLQASIYLGAAVVVVPLSVRLGLGSVLGYLAAGILMGPVMGLAGAETSDLQHFAEYGVVLMLFLIGLELQPAALWALRFRLIGMGGLQVGLTMALVAGAALVLGHARAVAVGAVLTLSSTAIVMQTLAEKGLRRTPGGRSSFAVLLFQDMAAVPILSIMPFLAPYISPETAGEATEGVAEPLFTLVHRPAAPAVAALTLAIVAGIVLVGHFLSRPVFRFVHAAQLPKCRLHLAAPRAGHCLSDDAGRPLACRLAPLSQAWCWPTRNSAIQLEADLQPLRGC